MGDRITRVTALHEFSRTRKAMNRHCTKVMLKSAAAGGVTAETLEQEASDMDAKTMKSFAGLQARIGATAMNYVAQLPEDKVKSFFEQDAEAQDAEVKTWDDAEKAKSAEAERLEKEKAAGDPVVTALRGELAELKDTVKSLTAGGADAALKEKAKAYPNVPNALDVLKSVAGLSEEAQAPTLAMLKSQNELAGLTTSRTIVDPSTVEGTAANRLKSVVKSYAAEHKVDESAALLAVADMAEHQELITEVRAEEEGGSLAA